MALKKKERPLSPEELKEKLRRETRARWLHGEPEFAFTSTPQGPMFLPLSKSMEKEITLLFLLDAADYVTHRTIEAIQIWKERYKHLPWNAVIAFQQKYLFLKIPQFFDPFKSIKSFATLPIYLDPFGELFEKFGSGTEPVVAMFSEGQLVYSTPLLPDFQSKILEIETTLQHQLRLRDVGLALPLLYQYQISAPVDQKMLRPEDVILEGNWANAGKAWATEDVKAVLTIPFEGKSLRWVAVLHPEARENCRLMVTFNGQPVNQTMSGAHVKYDEKGNSLIEVTRNTGNYELIESQTEIRGILKIQMINAMESPVIFYEARAA